MTEQVHISMTSDELRDLMAQAVEQGLNRAKVKKVFLRPTDAARALGVAYNTYKKMMAVTGRDHLYSDEVETLKQEYYGLRNRKQ